VADAAVKDLAGVEGVEVLLAMGGPNASGQLLLRVAGTGRERADRLQTVRARLNRIAEASCRLADPLADALPPPRRFPITLVVQSDESNTEAQREAEGLQAVLNKLPGLVEVRVPRGGSVPQLFLEIDREKAKQMGVRTEEIEATLRAVRSGIDPVGRGWEVHLAPTGRVGMEEETLKHLRIRNDRDQMVPLLALVKVTKVAGPTLLTRLDGRATVLLTADLAPGVSADEARRTVREAVRRYDPPRGVRVLLWGRDLDEPEDLTPKR
jgi:multidrug efflux pump subunit AcrB